MKPTVREHSMMQASVARDGTEDFGRTSSTAVSITCASCGHVQYSMVLTCVNVTLDPDLGPEAVCRESTKFWCDRCGWKEEVLHPILYHDMAKQFMIHLLPDGKDSKESAAIRQGLPETMLENYTLRIVSDKSELHEKFFALDQSLDDRVIEILKVELLKGLEAELETKKSRLVFMGPVRNPDGGEKELLFFWHIDSEINFYALPHEAYVMVAEEWSPKLPRRATELGKWLHVDRDYVASLGGEIVD